MCLLVFAYHTHPRYGLVLAANRDEFHARPTQAAHLWPDRPDLLAGRDLLGAGTWLGVTRSGRVAALTNLRDPMQQRPGAPSRGPLVVDALADAGGIAAFLERLQPRAQEFNPFNLVAIDASGCHHFASGQSAVRSLEPGVWGMSNGPIDAVWPKTARLKSLLEPLLAHDRLEPNEVLAALGDTKMPADGDLPDTGVGLDWERRLAPVFIRSLEYGTRCSTVLLMGYDGHIRFVERSYDAKGHATGEVDLSLAIEGGVAAMTAPHVRSEALGGGSPTSPFP